MVLLIEKMLFVQECFVDTKFTRMPQKKKKKNSFVVENWRLAYYFFFYTYLLLDCFVGFKGCLPLITSCHNLLQGHLLF